MVRDTMGNELKPGDLVALQLERPLIFGRIAEVSEGGIITGVKHGQAEVRMSRVVVISHHPVDTDPRLGQVPSIVKLHDPAQMSQQLEELKIQAPN